MILAEFVNFERQLENQCSYSLELERSREYVLLRVKGNAIALTSIRQDWLLDA
jgi:hypothetical protein